MPPRQMTREELRERMGALDLSAYALAKELGVTSQAMYYWLDGTNPIPAWLDLALQTVERDSTDSTEPATPEETR